MVYKHHSMAIGFVDYFSELLAYLIVVTILLFFLWGGGGVGVGVGD